MIKKESPFLQELEFSIQKKYRRTQIGAAVAGWLLNWHKDGENGKGDANRAADPVPC